ncbi:Hypothetical predicted protein [Drosophila guanche]|uniref:Uncharacterized protein n=1 Tax=Drosophila guanche TaxID=7266 RepID=A0A3B0K5Q7_DROGU|nr:Hypothetical predicted protein [Drosophila guanche]
MNVVQKFFHIARCRRTNTPEFFLGLSNTERDATRHGSGERDTVNDVDIGVGGSGSGSGRDGDAGSAAACEHQVLTAGGGPAITYSSENQRRNPRQTEDIEKIDPVHGA